MKKIALVISHIDSGSKTLCKILDNNPRIQWFETRRIYDHPSALELLTEEKHKLNDTSAIWLDDILTNPRFTNKSLYEFCKFIYVIRDGKTDVAENYYAYRLRKMYKMAKASSGVLLTWDDLITGRCFGLLEDYLCLSKPLVNLDYESGRYVDKRLQSIYDKYYSKFNKLSILRVK